MAQSTAMEIAAYHMVFYSTRRRTLWRPSTALCVPPNVRRRSRSMRNCS
ncbi:hypothetical protein CVT25_006349 [Psilocybe cyanescens]|uniref:Uncharacterized protein n=1 Tax=Psilocybe cyanescens TaxID=93625 RepID=A0A409WYM9_PSICY|nr:hypothetical protein CVT25_006349 [Psilocybe cyanescens]